MIIQICLDSLTKGMTSQRSLSWLMTKVEGEGSGEALKNVLEMKVDAVTDFVKELSKDVGQLNTTQTETSAEVKEIHMMLKELFRDNRTAKGNKEGGDNAEANKEGDKENKTWQSWQWESLRRMLVLVFLLWFYFLVKYPSLSNYPLITSILIIS